MFSSVQNSCRVSTCTPNLAVPASHPRLGETWETVINDSLDMDTVYPYYGLRTGYVRTFCTRKLVEKNVIHVTATSSKNWESHLSPPSIRPRFRHDVFPAPTMAVPLRPFLVSRLCAVNLRIASARSLSWVSSFTVQRGSAGNP